jgi:hypothetical protein
MNQLVPIAAYGTLIAAAGECAQERFASDATAFALRSNPYHLEILGFWGSAESDAANLEWVERFFAAMQPFSAGEVYVNSLDEGEGHRVREAYRTNYASWPPSKPNLTLRISFAAVSIFLPVSAKDERQPGDA